MGQPQPLRISEGDFGRPPPIALWAFGPSVEVILRRRRFIAFYLICGLGGIGGYLLLWRLRFLAHLGGALVGYVLVRNMHWFSAVGLAPRRQTFWKPGDPASNFFLPEA